jgi:hypothetical protein
LVSVHAQITKRGEQGAKLMDLCSKPNPDKCLIDLVMQALHEMVDQDGDYLRAQLELYKNDLKEASDELATIQEESEQQIKDGN